MDDDVLDGLEAAYQGEVYGEVLYEGIATRQAVPERAWQWRVLARMERETADLLAASLGRLGRSVAPDADWQARGEIDAARYGALAWEDLLATFARELETDIAAYSDLERRAGGREAVALARLVEHEVVTRDYCLRALEGRADALEPVLAIVAAPPEAP